ncbi:MAG: peptidoglycan DD-metalloendopeptidase family protein [Bacteroidales bacterium]|nr:peptidoglycan DD-metalloendopeptidase family protein [Bacteroidales bacterium]
MHKFSEISPYERHFSSNIDHREYFPYGEVWVNERSSEENHDMPYKYTGKEYDPETKLTYYGARYYDAKLSRWISVDPILASYLTGKPAGGVYNPINLNLYHYAENNPVMFTDPNGMWTNPVKKSLIRGYSTVGQTSNGIYRPHHNTFGTVRTDGAYYPGFSAGNPADVANQATHTHSQKHSGVDILASGGTTIYSVGDGKVESVIDSDSGDYGKRIIISFKYNYSIWNRLGDFFRGASKAEKNYKKSMDGQTLFASYNHLSDTGGLTIGDKLKEGQKIGKSGITGNGDQIPSDEHHLHFEMGTGQNGNKVLNRQDPAKLFQGLKNESQRD